MRYIESGYKGEHDEIILCPIGDLHIGSSEKGVKKMKTAREILKEIGYEEELLSTMTDEDCEAELVEIPYNQ